SSPATSRLRFYSNVLSPQLPRHEDASFANRRGIVPVPIMAARSVAVPARRIFRRANRPSSTCVLPASAGRRFPSGPPCLLLRNHLTAPICRHRPFSILDSPFFHPSQFILLNSFLPQCRD